MNLTPYTKADAMTWYVPANTRAQTAVKERKLLAEADHPQSAFIAMDALQRIYPVIETETGVIHSIRN